MIELKKNIEYMYDQKSIDEKSFHSIFQKFINALNAGEIRSATFEKTEWVANEWVKKGILLGFKFGTLKSYGINDAFPFYDKDTFPLRPIHLKDHIRIVPGGTSIRTGTYIASDVIIMPPAYINVGAYVDANTMIDSHALVGSCAQIGKRVHLSAAAQVGGVLEPVGAIPVIIEDDVLVGGNCGIYEGTIVKKGAVIAAGTILTRSIPVYDLINEKIIRGSVEMPLIIPENAVVIPGTRPVRNSEFANHHQLQVNCGLIIKYRDERTNAATIIETFLR